MSGASSSEAALTAPTSAGLSRRPGASGLMNGPSSHVMAWVYSPRVGLRPPAGGAQPHSLRSHQRWAGPAGVRIDRAGQSYLRIQGNGPTTCCISGTCIRTDCLAALRPLEGWRRRPRLRQACASSAASAGAPSAHGTEQICSPKAGRRHRGSPRPVNEVALQRRGQLLVDAELACAREAVAQAALGQAVKGLGAAGLDLGDRLQACPRIFR